jgi:HSP20 family protein
MLTTWDAVSALDRMFDDVMGSTLGTATNSKTFVPAIDIRATAEEVMFVCDVPGVKEDDLEITLERHLLTIKGVRRFEARAEEQVVLGRSYGAFTRSFELPDGLEEEKVSAGLEAGVLTIRIPKQERAKPRKIKIGPSDQPKQLTE